ncbi:MAG TPA: hypothetical protein VEF06_07865 [Bryobacteraceae bacterium]|nr:hypothetical protein [Bryobacteraceae bacterium]
MRVLILLLAGASLFAADSIDGFVMWKPAELKTQEEALSKKVGPDHSSRETLADFETHRFRMLYRDADGFPEQHDTIIDVVMVQSGEGTLVLGGKMIGLKASEAKGEYTGTGLEGGQEYKLSAGDIVHIPAKVPHRFLVPKGKHITYVLLKFPA